MDKPTLGILGLGSQTTAFYLIELNRVFNEKKGGYSTCPLVLFNTNFDAINSLLPNVSYELDDIVQSYISELEKTAVEHLLVPNITLYETIDLLKFKKKILHSVDICVSKMKDQKRKQVVLFGSLHIMKSEYIRTSFANNDIKIVLPTEENMQFIDQIRKDVYAEKQTEELITNYHLMIEKYTANHSVILACTELSIFKINNKNVLDMAQLQIEEAVKKVLLNTF
jgi:aspartate racemase